MTALLVRYAHSRFQLRRGTAITTVLGGVMIALGAVGLFSAVASGPTHPTAMICPALAALAFGFAGFKVLNAGALLLEAEPSGIYVASLDRRLPPAEVRGIEVHWRHDLQRDKQVEVSLTLEGGTRADVTQGWLPYLDPDALAAQLSSVLGAPAQVDQQPSEPAL